MAMDVTGMPFHQAAVQQQQTPAAPTGSSPFGGPRSYKSRKERPCDFCRARKVACRIEVAPPCNLCRTHGTACTFVERPGKRKRPNHNGAGNANGAVSEDGQSGKRSRTASSSTHHSRGDATPGSPTESIRVTPVSKPGSVNSASPTTSRGILVNAHSKWDFTSLEEQSLDSHPSMTARLAGDTSESNRYLLQHYKYNDDDECTVSRITYRRMISDSSHSKRHAAPDDPPIIFMLADDSLAQKGEPRIEPDVLERMRQELDEMFSDEFAVRLVNLFFTYVYPYFPILSRTWFFPDGSPDSPSISKIRSLPLSLRSSLYASACPFFLYDDLLATHLIHSPPDTARLFRISWTAIQQELHTPHLATLQACLLLQQRPPTNRYVTDTPWKRSLMGWTTGLAQNLGLARECGSWIRVPVWERRLRIRLWWAVYVMDKWISLGAGMPSYISDEDFDVAPLHAPPPLLDPSSPHPPLPALGPHDVPSSCAHFYHLVSLTRILADIVTAFFSVAATARTAHNLPLSLELARPLRARLRDWNAAFTASLPHPRATSPAGSSSSSARATAAATNDGATDAKGRAALDGNPSLGLAYVVAAMTLFRALLRPLEDPLPQAHPSPSSQHQHNHHHQPSSLSSNPAAANYNANHNPAAEPPPPQPSLYTPAATLAAREAVRRGAHACGREVVEFAESLGKGAWDAFWHSWSRANFAVASGFLMQLLLTCPGSTSTTTTSSSSDVGTVPPRKDSTGSVGVGGEDEAETVRALIARWRWAMRVGSASVGSGIMSLGLLRVDGLMSGEAMGGEGGGRRRSSVTWGDMVGRPGGSGGGGAGEGMGTVVVRVGEEGR